MQISKPIKVATGILLYIGLILFLVITGVSSDNKIKKHNKERAERIEAICLSNFEGDEKYMCLALTKNDMNYCKLISASVLGKNCFYALKGPEDEK